MPIYEFRCEECRRITNVFVRSVGATVAQPVCEHCGSRRTARTLSKFSVGRTEQQVLDSYGDPSLGDVDEYRDPRQIGRWVEKRFEDYGMEMPSEARQMIDAAREGEFPAPLDEPL
jgi:putative FmdB family regulatory protein